jgi:hypothetical protein
VNTFVGVVENLGQVASKFNYHCAEDFKKTFTT